MEHCALHRVISSTKTVSSINKRIQTQTFRRQLDYMTNLCHSNSSSPKGYDLPHHICPDLHFYCSYWLGVCLIIVVPWLWDLSLYILFGSSLTFNVSICCYKILYNNKYVLVYYIFVYISCYIFIYKLLCYIFVYISFLPYCRCILVNFVLNLIYFQILHFLPDFFIDPFIIQ